jgi:prevent-host-death family protein
VESIGASAAKTHLPELLERVARGERITITRHCTPVAVLIPPNPARTTDVETVIEELRAFCKRGRLGDDSTIREMIEESALDERAFRGGQLSGHVLVLRG